jgi:pilus assembly protein FimV
MHLRKLVLACGFASLALSNYASALGLGEVKLKSSLNQPLSAEIQLLDTRDLSADQILISLASPADFERNGVERLYFYTEFQFEVALDNPGGPVVRVTTRNPVREPYLNFLVEARWTAGRYMREYTVLMDLPTYDDAAPAAVQAPQAAPKVAAPSATRVTPPAEKPPVSAPQSSAPEEKPEIIAEQDQAEKKPKAGSGTYGPIGKNDTLWEIAQAVRPDSSVSVHQTMLALQRLNPDAFINGNINLIKKGQVLRVPDANEINSVSKSEAVRQFNAQIGQASADSSLGAQLDATNRTSSAKRANEPASGRVRLQAPSAVDATGGQGSGANKGSGKALEAELATTLEELDKAKSEKTELSSRVHELEEQVKTMQRLVDVSNEKLRALQLNAAKTDTAAKASAPAKDVATTAPAEKPASVAAVTSSAASSEVIAAVPAEKPAEPAKPAPKPKKVVVPPPPEPTLVDKLMEYAPWLGLGAAGLAAGGFVLIRRRKAEADAQAQAEAEMANLRDDEPDFSAFNEQQGEPAAEPDPIDEMSLFDEEDTTAVAETGDVVGEADIYIAYGKFDQAEEMLLNGLAKDPANTDIRLKLLEVYSQTQSLAEFDKHYATILPLASGFALNRAAELRANIEGAGEFNKSLAPAAGVAAAGVAAAAASSAIADDEFEIDDIESSVQPSNALADDDFSFDLDLDDADVNPSSAHYDMDLGDKPVAASNAQLDDDFNLDFDLPDEPVSKAEDLSDITLALDSLDEEVRPTDLESSPEDEFSFDFNELDDETTPVAQEVESIAAPQLADDDFNPEALGDDFNLEMDVDDLDLATLDHEMEALDKDLDVNDDDLFAGGPAAAEKFDFDDGLGDLDLKLDEDTLPEDLPADDGFAALDSTQSFAGDNEFSLDDLDLDIGSSDVNSLSSSESLAGDDLEKSLPAGDFSFDDDLALDSEFGEGSAADSDLALDDDLNVDEELSFEVSDDDLLADEEAVASLDELSDDLSLDADEFDLESFDESQGESLQDLDAAFDEIALGEEDQVPSLQDNAIAPEVELEDDAGLMPDEHLSDVPVVALDDLDASAAESGEPLSDDDLFEQALSDFSADDYAMDETSDLSDEDMDDELDFMGDADEAATKLDLARAYIDMGDSDGARDILAEVAQEGNDEQRQEAADLLSRIDA